MLRGISSVLFHMFYKNEIDLLCSGRSHQWLATIISKFSNYVIDLAKNFAWYFCTKNYMMNFASSRGSLLLKSNNIYFLILLNKKWCCMLFHVTIAFNRQFIINTVKRGFSDHIYSVISVFGIEQNIIQSHFSFFLILIKTLLSAKFKLNIDCK